MLDYFSNQEYFIDRLWFYHDGSLHDGNGFMAWNPAEGFHIAGRVTRSRPYPREKYINAISFDQGVMLRMKLENGLRAFAPRVRVNDLLLALGGHVSLNLHRLFFMQTLDKETDSASWSGSALIETKTNLTLPDSVQSETRIGDWKPSHAFSRSGLYYEDESGQRIVAQLKDKTHLFANWSLPKSQWTKSNAWHFAQGLQDAISLVAGELLQLRQHEMYRGRYMYSEMRSGYKTSSLGIILHLFDQDFLDKDMIVRFANFLARGGRESDICRKMFQQLADAAEQKTRQGTELLVSTILEATLRSLYNNPFSSNKNRRTDTFSLEGSLRIFRDSFMYEDVDTGRKWKKVTTKVVEAQRRLRDRNAHPDWLSSPGGAYSPDALKQSTNDLILLTRFYGYMILALAGFKELEPKFPASVDSWSPMVTVSHTDSQNES